MAFKMKNTPDKMFHKASGEVQQPQLPGVQEPGGYGKNPEAVGKQVGIFGPVGLGMKVAKGLAKGVAGAVSKGKQMVADYSAGKQARETAAKKPAAKKPSSGTYESAKKNNPNLDKLIKTRSSSKKGSQEYADAQNAINKAYGNKKVHSVSKPAAKPTAKPVAVSGDSKPKAESPKPKAPVKPKSRKEVRVENRANRKTARKARKSARQMNRANKLMAKAGGAKKPEAANAKYKD